MKTKRIFFVTLFLILMMNTAAVFPQQSKAEAASLTNVMKAQKAQKGKIVRTSKGIRYRYTSTKKYAKSAWLKISGKIYYFSKDGYAVTGWKTYRKHKYYFDKNGRLVTGWKTIGKNKYYFWKDKGDLSGTAATGKVKISSRYYYFSSSGVMQTGWQNISGYYYYFNTKSGKMAVSTKVGKYKVDSNGRRITQTSGKVDYWVGDSRTVGLCAVKGISSKGIAMVNAGYSWYTSSAEGALKKKLNKKPTATVVINFGVNDVGNVSKYIKRYQKLVKAYPKAHFYFMSVNPIDSKYKAGYVSNAKIKAFNKKLKAAFPGSYIDTYSYLNKKGFSTVDGLHYTAATYKVIYNYVLTKV